MSLGLIVGTNNLDDWVFEDLIKVLEAIVLEHVGTIFILMKIWRFDVSHVDQALYACSLFRLRLNMFFVPQV